VNAAFSSQFYGFVLYFIGCENAVMPLHSKLKNVFAHNASILKDTMKMQTTGDYVDIPPKRHFNICLHHSIEPARRLSQSGHSAIW